MNVFAFALLFSLGLLFFAVTLGFALYRDLAPVLRRMRPRPGREAARMR
ncbi:MAG: hypothetical protein JNK37_07705 [Verrucomicrobiales bacterium]|nr:hypothetical protein [Verrucomicrobiales bacterium]